MHQAPGEQTGQCQPSLFSASGVEPRLKRRSMSHLGNVNL